MKNIKEQFDDFRSSTPKYVQWLLLVVAFLIVIILLTLLITSKSTNDKPVEEGNQPPVFEFNPNSIEFENVKVGDVSRKAVNISVNMPVVIDSTKISAKGFIVSNDCLDMATTGCKINVTYKPVAPQTQSQTTLVINWYVESQEEIINQAEIPVDFSAYAEPEPIVEPEPEPEPEPIVEPEPEPEPIIEPEPEKDPNDEIREIAVPNPFEKPIDKEPVGTPEKPERPVMPPKQCSEFAIPGYDASGRQIGWIRPERGANYFHPFSDKDCSKPTGEYNLKTGVITSLKDGSKIGTDSDHIGYRNVHDRNLKVPQLSNSDSSKSRAARAVNGSWGEDAIWKVEGDIQATDWKSKFEETKNEVSDVSFEPSSPEHIVSSQPYDRTFILRQFKPIPATIVSEVRADPSVYGYAKDGKTPQGKNHSIPVRATVDRNVYSDNGRTIIIPTGTLLMGYLEGELPGPYQAFGRMNIRWYQFIRPDGVEFNFKGEDQDPYSGDAQGRMGVPGHGSTDYVEQMVMPILTALVPAAVNMIAPITDTVINQIDLDNNTIVQSGTIRSSEMAKQDIINTWNKITQKLIVDAIDNTVPPFSIAAGTRINVFSPVDLVVTCGDPEKSDKKCAIAKYDTNAERRSWSQLKNKVQPASEANIAAWKGQVRSFNLNNYCEQKNGKVTIKDDGSWVSSGYDYRTVLAYCEAQNYTAINNAKQDAYNKQVQAKSDAKKEEYGTSWNATTGKWENTFGGDEEKEKQYNTEVLGLSYDADGNIINPFAKGSSSAAPAEPTLDCGDGVPFDENGCCPGETYTDMGDDGWNCCPDAGGDCFPPTIVD